MWSPPLAAENDNLACRPELQRVISYDPVWRCVHFTAAGNTPMD